MGGSAAVQAAQVVEPLRAPDSGVVRRDLAFETRARCVTCDGTTLDEVWSGRFDEQPVRGWIERHHYAGDPLAALRGHRFRLVRCRDCTMLFHARVLSAPDLARLYAEWIDDAQIERFEADIGGQPRAASLFEQGRRSFKHLLRMRRLVGDPVTLRVLDFGCGDGRVLGIAQALGMDAWGVDSSATREARAEQAGVRIVQSLDALAARGATRFDAVMMIDVLEHLTDPRGTLDAIARVMRPGGVLLVEVPDARPLRGAPRTFEEMRLVQPLEHVNAFVPSTLARICGAAGFDPAPTLPAHATLDLRDVLRAELARLVRLRRTSGYFVRRGAIGDRDEEPERERPWSPLVVG